ncbi:MAG: archaetidylserine decarboxylase [Oscillospiraceae bacterium]
MKYRDRFGNTTIKTDFQEKLIESLYSNVIGRAILKPLTAPAVSKFLSGALNHKVSCVIINPFIKSNGINMDDYEFADYNSYNDFFIRQIKSGKRTFDMSPNALVSPSDGKATVYKIDKAQTFRIKNTSYTVSSLLKNDSLSEEFCGGMCIVIRLSVDNYHRYCYPDNAVKSENVFIPGKLHTVNPIAFEYDQVFKENSREYCILETENFGRIVQMEVGALMVGKIVNYHQEKSVKKGEEKGHFEFGGSTIVLLLKKDSVDVDNDIIQNSAENFETVVKMGEKIASKLAF